MDAEKRWQAIVCDLEALRKQVSRKVRGIDVALSDLQMLQRQLGRARVQEIDAWIEYRRSLKERGL